MSDQPHGPLTRTRPPRTTVVVLMLVPLAVTAANFIGVAAFDGLAVGVNVAVAVAAVETLVYHLAFMRRIPRAQEPMGAVVPVTVITSLMAAHYWNTGAWDPVAVLSVGSACIFTGILLLLICASLALGLHVLVNPEMAGSFFYGTDDADR